MSKQLFDAHDDVIAPPPPKGPKIITAIVVVLGLVAMIAISMQPPRKSPPPAQVDTTATDTATSNKTAADTSTDTSATDKPAASSEDKKETPPVKDPTKTYTAPTPAEVNDAKAKGMQHATIVTVKGTIEVELDGKEAPLTVANFVKLAKANFYDGLTFHRVEPGFVIQGGDPEGNGMGGPGYSIKLEIAPHIKHIKGAIAMARSQNPDSAGSQFYITLAPTPFLDKNYAVFGKVTKGMDVVEQIQVGDGIKSITIH